MRQYGKKLTYGSVANHQNCYICHPKQKSTKRRARRQAKKQIQKEVDLETSDLELDIDDGD